MKSFAGSLVILLLVPLFAVVDVTGTWSGTLTVTRADGTVRSSSAWAQFKQEGTVVTGSMGDGPQDPHAISEGMIKENKLNVRIAQGGSTLVFELTIDGDQINGTGSRLGTSETAVLELSRQK